MIDRHDCKIIVEKQQQRWYHSCFYNPFCIYYSLLFYHIITLMITIMTTITVLMIPIIMMIEVTCLILVGGKRLSNAKEEDYEY